MLSQERVIALLYEKTFPMTSAEMQNAEDIQDMNDLQAHQQAMQQQMQYQQQMQMEGDENEEEDEYDPEEAETYYAMQQQEILREHQQ